ncbi:Methenyltetrahydrofolate cyclohydrolase [Clostridiales bacterium CHKCI001]|nr:Methenyltetrahydrofolate cyclohydrolase [Clostridiales bacterium CHKCI001]
MNAKTMKIEEFTDVLASKAAIPGGGGASALTGALGTALGTMVGNLTVGKKKYKDVEEEIRRQMQQAEVLQRELLLLIDKDAEAFEPLSKAYGLPKETKEQLEYRNKVMEEALLKASLVPLKIMETVLEAIAVLEVMAEKGSRIAVSDAGVGVQFCRAALLGASMNVFINTKLMKDREKASQLNQRCDELMEDGVKRADAVFELVMKTIRP